MQSLEYLRANRPYLNLSHIAREIGTDPATLTTVVKGQKLVKGGHDKKARFYTVKRNLPAKCVAPLDTIIEKLKK